MTKKIIVLCGNDGTGKTTLCTKINSECSNFIAVERSQALIKRKGETVNIEKDKCLVAAEHVYHVQEFFRKNFQNESIISLDRVIGSSEGYMVNIMKSHYDLCDALVESGRTLEENNLEIWKVVLNYGEVKIGLYK